MLWESHLPMPPSLRERQVALQRVRAKCWFVSICDSRPLLQQSGFALLNQAWPASPSQWGRYEIGNHRELSAGCAKSDSGSSV